MTRTSARKRGYTAAWDKARAAFLAEPDNQFCRECEKTGLLNPGTMHLDGTLETNPWRMHLVVDHIIAHKNDQRLFWDRSNWQPLCPDHHDIIKQREEHGRMTGAVDINGRPVGAHPWNL
ncbi:HNH endonuclease signature motif containing protein [Devosia aurantiaca]|uniref:HNH endonuclease n=1 Tax=Devosia aurantiaca TaxID=2714858 RepID=A0A6M1SGE9_9HYPH|nr:HNH endonuclease signature motif containing protein [Devosia aurantiaca]NGP18909.1 HNH endonuclease [Devosia aurantiaca]